MITRSYDVIVAGRRPGGLLAGALLAKRGFRVLAIHQDDETPMVLGKYTFPSHRYPLTGLEHPEFLGGAFDALTIHPSERKLLQPGVPSYQVLMPQHRVDVYADERLGRELEREFGDEEKLLSAFYARLKDDAQDFVEFWRRRKEQVPTPTLMQKVGLGSLRRRESPLFPNRQPTVGDVYDELGLPPLLRTFLNAQLIAFGYAMAPEYLPMPIAAQLLQGARDGLYTDQERVEPLIDLLTERIKTLHSDVLPHKRIEQLEFSWGKFTEFTFEGDSHRSSCDYLIWNCAVQSLLPLLPDSVRSKGYEDRSMHGEYERFSIYLAVEEHVIPVGIQEHSIIVGDPELPLQDGNLVLTTLSPEGVESFAPAGVRTLTLSTVVKAERESRTKAARRETATIMLTHLKRVMPFLEDYVRALHIPEPDDLDVAGEVIFDARNMTRLFPTDAGPGPRLPHWNFFQIGRETWPLMGFDGEIGAAMLVDRAIATMASRR